MKPLNFKKHQEQSCNEVSSFILRNPQVVLYDKYGSLDYGTITLSYIQETKKYETNFLIPFCDKNGDHILQCSNYIRLDPLYCMMSRNVLTVEDFNRVELNNSKIEQLKELIDKIEKL